MATPTLPHWVKRKYLKTPEGHMQQRKRTLQTKEQYHLRNWFLDTLQALNPYLSMSIPLHLPNDLKYKGVVVVFCFVLVFFRVFFWGGGIDCLLRFGVFFVFLFSTPYTHILFNFATQIMKKCGRCWDDNLCPPGELEHMQIIHCLFIRI